MIPPTEQKKSRDSGSRYLLAEERVSSYAPLPNYSVGQAALVGCFVGSMALIAVGATAGLDVPTFISVATVGTSTVAPAAYYFHLQNRHNEAIRREMAVLEETVLY